MTHATTPTVYVHVEMDFGDPTAYIGAVGIAMVFAILIIVGFVQNVCLGIILRFVIILVAKDVHQVHVIRSMEFVPRAFSDSGIIGVNRSAAKDANLDIVTKPLASALLAMLDITVTSATTNVVKAARRDYATPMTDHAFHV